MLRRVRTLKQKCDATSTFYSALANEHGKFISLGGNIAHGTKLRKHYTNTLNSIDNAMKLAQLGPKRVLIRMGANSLRKP
ncbi:MAG: hypothetical protein IT174_06795 [Acidobacteria bacterium]|nr:hypothetical protein [Acidobacteriota bacterium]